MAHNTEELFVLVLVDMIYIHHVGDAGIHFFLYQIALKSFQFKIDLDRGDQAKTFNVFCDRNF